MVTAEFSKFAGILSVALSQHHLSGFEKDLAPHLLGEENRGAGGPERMTASLFFCTRPSRQAEPDAQTAAASQVEADRTRGEPELQRAQHPAHRRGCCTHRPCLQLSPQEELLWIKGSMPPSEGQEEKPQVVTSFKDCGVTIRPERNLPKPAVWEKNPGAYPLSHTPPARQGKENNRLERQAASGSVQETPSVWPRADLQKMFVG